MQLLKWLGLQLFAGGDGGAGAGADGSGEGAGDAAEQGVEAVDAEQQRIDRLKSLGVPEGKIRAKNRAHAKAPVSGTIGEQPAAAQPEVQETAEPGNNPKKATWDELMADPEYNQKMQETVQKRVKDDKELKDFKAKITPAIELIAQHYGLDIENLDVDALTKAVQDDDQYYEEKALEMGVPIETAKRMDQLEKEQAKRQKEEEESLQEQQIRQHIEGLEKQAQALGIDLRAELQNPTFAKLTAPGIGLSVEDAYFATHRGEIQQAQKEQQIAGMNYAAQQTAQRLSNSILAGQRRPDEGVSPQGATIGNIDWHNASAAQRKAQREAILAAAARGEKIYPSR